MLRVLFTGFAIAALAAPALAKPARPPAMIDVHNQRSVALNTFSLSTTEGEKVVAKLAKPLAAGGKTRLRIAGAKGCNFLARWEFEDAGDEAPVDLCHDPKIILTD